jgi:hypothetical protein
MKIQFPVYDNNGKLKMNPEYRNDECLEFFPDGHIESNGGRVEHHEIDEESLGLLPEVDRENVRKFLAGNYGV